MRRISEELTRSELESMERDDEFASFYPDQQFRIAVHEHQRQAREASGCERIKNIQNRNDGRMEENERRVAQFIGSETRDALSGQRSHMLHEHQVLLQAGGKEEESVKSQMQSELQSHNVRHRRTLHDRDVQQEHLHNTWNSRRHK